MKKYNILIGCILFRELTGSEMYVYELAKGLLNNNFDVSIVSPNIGGFLTQKAINEGINVYDFNTLPKNKKFDLIHCQHTPITNELIRLFPLTKKICTIHSEVNSLENPVQHTSILKYIAIRPQIKEHIINNFKIKSDMIEVIYNPINEKKFNQNNINDNNYVLFVGTIDYLRKEAIFDLVNYAKEIGKELWIVGRNTSNYLPYLLQNNHVKHFDSTYDIENFVKNCSETGGILLGRTTIEGWMCGKPGWIYDVNSNGNLISKKLHPIPNDIEKFYSTNVIEQIKNEYEKIITA
jgi:glycosyltransferase involved in cell wall biosynthesis